MCLCNTRVSREERASHTRTCHVCPWKVCNVCNDAFTNIWQHTRVMHTGGQYDLHELTKNNQRVQFDICPSEVVSLDTHHCPLGDLAGDSSGRVVTEASSSAEAVCRPAEYHRGCDPSEVVPEASSRGLGYLGYGGTMISRIWWN